jgi:4-diphosphocytidyl-2-C-methyl-D-erythritol kinase
VGFFADAASEATRAPRAALVGGFGDQVRRVDAAAAELVLIVPGYGCPTGPVYRAFDGLVAERQRDEMIDRARRGLTGKEKQTGPRETLVESRWRQAVEAGKVEGDTLFNDLAVPAYRVEPRLGQLATALARATRETVHVTGSGSCLFIPSTVGKVERLMERVERLLGAVSGDEFGAGAKVVRTRLV